MNRRRDGLISNGAVPSTVGTVRPCGILPARAAGVLAWVLVGVVVLMGAATLWLSRLNGGVTDQVGFMLPFLSFAPIGAVVASKRPGNAIGWLLLAVPGFAFVYVLGQQYAQYGLLTAPGAVPAAAFVAWVRLGMWVPVALLFMVWLPLLYPTGRALNRRWWAVGWAPTVVMAVALVAVMVTSWDERGVALLELESSRGELKTSADTIFAITFPVQILGGMLSWSSLLVRYRRGDRTERLQIRWLAFALAAFIGGLVLSLILPDLAAGRYLPGVFVPFVPAAIAVAVLRYRLYEIDRIISRALVYALVTAVLAGAYVALVVGFQTLLRPLTSGSDLAVAASTLAVAAAFGPLQRRVQRFVDRRFYRSRYDAARTVEAFGARLRDELDLDALHGELVYAVGRTVHPSRISLWLREVTT